jgi:hypothetical protein
MTEVRFQGAMDRRTFVAAQRLALRNRRAALVAALVVLAVVAILVLAPLLRGRPPGLGVYVEVLLFAGLWPLLLWVLLPLLQAQRLARTSAAFGRPLSGVADADRIHVESARGAADLAWSTFHRARFADALVLLYQSEQTYMVFPRAFFASAEDWQTFLALAQAKVPASRRVPPPQRGAAGGGGR